MTRSWKWVATAGLGRADSAILKAIQEGSGEWTGEPVACSRTQIQRLIEEGMATLDGRPIQARTTIGAGAEIRVTFPAPKSLDVLPEDRPIEILFQDEHILVLNKPQGLTVHPSTTQMEGTLVNALLHHVRDLSGIGGKLRPGIVHRLDKDTSGALVITKTDVAHRKLVEVFARHGIERRYWALVYGAPVIPESLKIDNLLGRSPKDRKKMAVLPPGSKAGRRAISHVRLLEEFGRPGAKPYASLLEVTLETGRTHQVRVHLTALQHSILGDPVYGTPSTNQPKWQALPSEIRAAVKELPGQALHARVLGFEHPVTGAKLRFEAEPPEAFKSLQALMTENCRVPPPSRRKL